MSFVNPRREGLKTFGAIDGQAHSPFRSQSGYAPDSLSNNDVSQFSRKLFMDRASKEN
jgi:hypothetical protein